MALATFVSVSNSIWHKEGGATNSGTLFPSQVLEERLKFFRCSRHRFIITTRL